MSRLTYGVITEVIVLLNPLSGGEPVASDIDRQLRVALQQAGFTTDINSGHHRCAMPRLQPAFFSERRVHQT